MARVIAANSKGGDAFGQRARETHLDVEGKPVLLERVEVEDQLMPALRQRRQVAIAIHKDGLAL